MGLLSWLDSIFPGEDTGDSENETEESEKTEGNLQEEKKTPVSGHGIALFEPADSREGLSAADQLLSGSDVVLNLRRLDENEKQRITDFLCGITYRTGFEMIFVNSEVLVCRRKDSDGYV